MSVFSLDRRRITNSSQGLDILIRWNDGTDTISTGKLAYKRMNEENLTFVKFLVLRNMNLLWSSYFSEAPVQQAT